VRLTGLAAPYRPVLAHPVLRRVLPGFVVSALGDAMSYLAISWLAIDLAPAGTRGVWVGAAVAAYTLPGALGTVLFGRWLRGRSGAQLAGWDALLRGSALAAVPLAAALDRLSIGLLVALLGVSSLLHSWGSAGRYTLLAEVLPPEDRLAGNAVVSTTAELTTLVGPLLAGVLTAWHSPTLVIAVDAATFGVLAATYRLAVPRERRRARVAPGSSRSEGFATIRADRRLTGLLALSFSFFLLYGPVQVALPLTVSLDRGGSATDLGLLWTAFGVGAIVGGLLTGYLRRWPLWRITIGTVLVWGLSLLPIGLGAPLLWCVLAMGVGGLAYGPYGATSMALFQRSTSIERLPEVLAAQSAVILLSVPVGAALGGPLIGLVGAQHTMLASGVATITLALVAAGLVRAAPRVNRI
jgi:DHA3 family macrolide efflux protein-like MFS transporter